MELEELYALMERFARSGLTDLEWEREGEKIALRRSAAPAPGEEAFAAPGKQVKKGETLCLIEAMKMMSEIPAPCDCEITAVLKENGALVSFGEPLFRYQPC